MGSETPDPHSGHCREVAENVNLSANEKGIDGGNNEQSSPSSGPPLLDQETIERLGRQRPPHFSNIWTELAFCFSIFMCQILAVWIYFPVLVFVEGPLRLTYTGILHLWI